MKKSAFFAPFPCCLHLFAFIDGLRAEALECKIMNIPMPDKTRRVRNLTRILENASRAFGEFIRVIRGQVLRLRPAPGFLYTNSDPYRRLHPPAAVNYPHEERIRSTSEESRLPAGLSGIDYHCPCNKPNNKKQTESK